MRVDGDITKTDFAAFFTVAGWIVLVLWWFAVTVSLLIVGLLIVLLFPRAAQTVAAVGRESAGISVAWGAGVGLAAPWWPVRWPRQSSAYHWHSGSS